MIKSVFVGLNLAKVKYAQLGGVGANHLIIAGQNINKKKWGSLRKTGADLTISIGSFPQGGCPLNPAAKEKLQERINQALKWEPKEIWLDHFRFDGHWESVTKDKASKEYIYRGLHAPCRWCGGKNRSQGILKLAQWAKSLIPKNTSVGYFAVPFKLDEHTKLASELGQDHRLLGKIFDIVSPMLYHRMIKKPVSYISEYVKYLHSLTRKPVLPIIQIKDMPDDLPDRLSAEEILAAFKEAKKQPSIGVSIFVWEHAIEKNKTGLIKRLFSDV